MSRSIAGASIAAAVLISSMSVNAKQLAAKCWKDGDPIPPFVELKGDSHGVLFWNEKSADWKTIQFWLKFMKC